MGRSIKLNPPKNEITISISFSKLITRTRHEANNLFLGFSSRRHTHTLVFLGWKLYFFVVVCFRDDCKSRFSHFAYSQNNVRDHVGRVFKYTQNWTVFFFSSVDWLKLVKLNTNSKVIRFSFKFKKTSRNSRECGNNVQSVWRTTSNSTFWRDLHPSSRFYVCLSKMGKNDNVRTVALCIGSSSRKAAIIFRIQNMGDGREKKCEIESVLFFADFCITLSLPVRTFKMFC